MRQFLPKKIVQMRKNLKLFQVQVIKKRHLVVLKK